MLTPSLPPGSAVESVSIKFTPGSAGGPANVVARATGSIKVRVAGQQVPMYLTVVYIMGRLIEAEVGGVNVGTPLPAYVVNPLVAKMAARVARA